MICENLLLASKLCCFTNFLSNSIRFTEPLLPYVSNIHRKFERNSLNGFNFIRKTLGSVFIESACISVYSFMYNIHQPFPPKNHKDVAERAVCWHRRVGLGEQLSILFYHFMCVSICLSVFFKSIYVCMSVYLSLFILPPFHLSPSR